MALNPLKQCSKCRKLYPPTPDYFHRNRNAPDGLNRQCKKCINTYQKDWLRRRKENIVNKLRSD